MRTCNLPDGQSALQYTRSQFLTLAEQLFAPELSYEVRLEIAPQMRILLTGQEDWIPPPVRINLETA
jgi:hypothetical protein